MRIKLGLVDPKEEVDKSAIVVTYFDDSYSQQLSTSNFTLSKLNGSTERGSTNIIEGDEVWEMVVTLPVSATVSAYDWAIVQIIPPKGASLHIKRTMPGYLSTYFALN